MGQGIQRGTDTGGGGGEEGVTAVYVPTGFFLLYLVAAKSCLLVFVDSIKYP